LANTNNTKSLKIFGSYAHGEEYFEQSNRLKDYRAEHTDFSNFNPAPTGFPFFIANPDYDPVNRFLQAGISLGLAEERLQVSYNYDSRQYDDSYLIPLPFGGCNTLFNFRFKSNIHRLGIMGKIINENNFTWFTGINATTGKVLAKNNPLSGTG